jgi:predicted flap endonuclease-1-like 5' DNA nuclease
MELIQEYWWLLVIVAALVIGVILLRPRQRVKLTDSAPVRPHMANPSPPEGRGIAGEAAAAASDVTGELLGAPVHDKLHGIGDGGDDLCQLKGVGPKLAGALRAQGIINFDQLAGLSATEVERLDSKLGAFRGRLTRDRVIEQAAFLARNDIDGFEQNFGKLGG